MTTSQTLPSTSRQHEHFHGLDLLRTLAILMVIPYHARNKLDKIPLTWATEHGWAGVDLFFVLSGFLIGSQLLQAMQRRGKIPFREFYLKRAFRILPCYFFVLALYLFWPAFREAPQMDPPWKFVLFVMNFDLHERAFSHAWSLCVEEHFYLVLPLILSLSPRLRQRFSATYIVAGLVLAGIALRWWLWDKHFRFWSDIYRPSYCRLDGIVAGFYLATLRERHTAVWRKLIARPWPLFLGGMVLLAGGLAAFAQEESWGAAVWAFPLVSFGYAGIITACLSPSFFMARWRIPGAALMAAWSYSLYLTHKQMIHLATLMADSKTGLCVFIAVGLIVLGAGLLHYGVEKPFLRLRSQFLHSRKDEASAVAIATPQELIPSSF